MKKLTKATIIVSVILITLGFAIQSCEACSECQGAIKKGETPPKYERKKWKLPALSAHMKVHEQIWEKVKSLEARIEELEHGSYPEHYTFKDIKFRVDRPVDGVSKVTVEK